MANQAYEREFEIVRDTSGIVLSNTPIHYAGMALLMENLSADASEVVVEDSPDGVNYSLVLVSTPAASGLSGVTMVGLAYSVILFASTAAYVRIRLAAANTAGVQIHAVQWTPADRAANSSY